MSALITARHLTKRYGRHVALDSANFDVQPGRIVGLIGPNGSGKTTTLKAILGLTRCEGELSVLGLDPRRDRDELMRDVCFSADVAILPRWLKVRDAVDFVAGIHPRLDRAKAERYLAPLRMFALLPVYVLWALPTVGWNSHCFVHHVVARLLTGVTPGSWFMYMRPASLADGGQGRLGVAELPAASLLSLGSPVVWAGVTAGVAMTAAAVWMRRWRDDV